jgi:hypothetical protein
MSRRTVRILVPESPLEVSACPAQADSIGLGQPPQSTEHRIFIFFSQPDEPGRGDIVHISIDNAGFLRDAIDTVLGQYRTIKRNAN